MKIDGAKIALEIYNGLKLRTQILAQQNVIPAIAVILVGDDPASISYIAQKDKWTKYIGGNFHLFRFSVNKTESEVLKIVAKLNNDPKIHGIIIQRPIPSGFAEEKFTKIIKKEKDIDGFREDSPFEVPVAKAVVRVLYECHPSEDFYDWLKSKSIVVIGKGKTAGGPIINYLKKKGIKLQVINSKTQYPESIIRESEIVISAVGKREVVKAEYLKKDAILIGVGLFKGIDGKLYGDYVPDTIKSQVSFYTPTIGGVGPINVSYLLENLVTSAESTINIDKKK